MPKIVDPTEKRAELVAASWDVIASEGLSGATLRRVASQAGCTTGALTHYFPDRAALLTQTLRAAHVQAGKRMAAAAASASSDHDRLIAVLLESLPLDDERLREWRVWLAFWAGSMSDADLGRENTSRYAEWRSLLAPLVLPLLADPSECEAIVEELIALTDGLGLEAARQRRRGKALVRQRQQCEETLRRHLSRLPFATKRT